MPKKCEHFDVCERPICSARDCYVESCFELPEATKPPQGSLSNSSDLLVCQDCKLLIETLEEMLPHMECNNQEQSNLITHIGGLIEQWKAKNEAH